LKTLEEPPGRLRLLLTAADPESLLPTVRSRCQRLSIPLPAAAEATEWLAGQGVEGAEVLLAAAGGQPQGVLALVEEGVGAADWAALPAAVRRGHAPALSSWPVPRVVDALHKLCHDLMSVQAGASPRYFSAAALAPAWWSALAAWQQALQQAARHEDHPWHASLRAEALVSQAAALWQTARATAPGRGGALATLPAR
jgi:DNA polymerase III subunit delta'